MTLLTAEQLDSMRAQVASTFETTVQVWRGMPRILVDSGVACTIRPADTGSTGGTGDVPKGDPYTVRLALTATVQRNDQLIAADGKKYLVERVIRYPATMVARVVEDLTTL